MTWSIEYNEMTSAVRCHLVNMNTRALHRLCRRITKRHSSYSFMCCRSEPPELNSNRSQWMDVVQSGPKCDANTTQAERSSKSSARCELVGVVQFVPDDQLV